MTEVTERPQQYAQLQAYPFAKLRELTATCTPNDKLRHIPLSLGEPKHQPPQFVIDYFSDTQQLSKDLATYPATRGSDALRQAIAAWIAGRFDVQVNPETQVLPVNGTREALFSFAQALLPLRPDQAPRVLMPNPFYQIYEGAALLAGAQPYFVNNDPAQDYQQDFSQVPVEVLKNTQIVYLCSPGNPTGQIMSLAQMQTLIEMAHKYDFVIASDECYSELYFDDGAAPVSLLSASSAMGNQNHARCVVFHSLSKRSNLPGLRSGFVAGDANLMSLYFDYRTYHGCAMSAHHQAVSTLAWQDEAHVQTNRALYREKFAKVTSILAPHYPLRQPAGGFYHWLKTPMDDLAFTQQLLTQFNVTVMPGQFLGRAGQDGNNPGRGHVRIAWVAALEDCVEAANRLASFAQTNC